ncbi:TrkH family potassium uptake protein [Halonatronum saccharophilum]|uniref:TrkH family potassium uptake protein n=1 Tax=Halonatronum saccharophilum TaxID=150060 RepID=UPI0004B20DA2|nr:TrkH family potassium uptake protein [Halonatronum saccharophilum]
MKEVRSISFRLSKLSPPQFLALGYLIVITIGAFLLTLPLATVDARGLNLLDAYFTATSATAVTGLIVVSTAEYLTVFGQVVVLVLIQIGAFGFMITSTILALILGRKIGFRERIIIKEDLNYFNFSGVINLARYVIALTLGIEFIGAVLLFFRFNRIMPLGRAIYFSIFHAISAFGNAGFDLFGDSLEGFVGDLYVNVVITTLFIVGGIGFTVIADLYTKRRFERLSLHSKLVILITVVLILIGTLGVFLLEFYNPNTFGELSIRERLISAYFQGVTPRTAGFNTIPIGNLTQATLFLIITLMFIGASPGSTGGGLKTTTIGVLIVTTYSIVTGKKDPEIFKRRISDITVYKSLSITIISLFIIIMVTFILSITEGFGFINILFETVSAYATVGLSTGITGELSSIGRVLITITMFIGRVGPLTLAVAIGERERNNNIRYPEEKLLIG